MNVEEMYNEAMPRGERILAQNNSPLLSSRLSKNDASHELTSKPPYSRIAPIAKNPSVRHGIEDTRNLNFPDPPTRHGGIFSKSHKPNENERSGVGATPSLFNLHLCFTHRIGSSSLAAAAVFLCGHFLHTSCSSRATPLLVTHKHTQPAQ